MADKFKIGDRVFAKVRGYPSWPARVKNVFADSSNGKNSRIEVFFFGTYETAMCRPEEVCDYEANKEKLGKMQKRKFFKEALYEIESDPHTEGPQRLLETSSDFQRDDDAMSEVSTASSKTLEGSAKPSRRQSVMKKRDSVDAADEETPAKKKAKKSEVPAESPVTIKTSPSTAAAVPEPERVSRSGRKIKPKRFLDEEDGHEEEKPDRRSISDELPRKIPKAPAEEPKKIATIAPIEPAKRAARFSSGETKKVEKGVVPAKSVAKGVGKGKDSDDFVPPTATVSPIVAPPPTAKKPPPDTKKMKVTFTQQQAQKMLDSDKTPDKVKDMLNKEMQAKMKEKEENLKSKKAEKRKTRLLFLKIEVRLLQIDTIIKANLNLEKAETKPVLQVLDELKNLKLSPIMLKKHPDIVFTIKKLRKYVGNSKHWNHNDEEKVNVLYSVPHIINNMLQEEFSKKAGEIRQKATQIFEYFKFVLLGSKDSTDVTSKFLKQISELKEKTKHLGSTKLAALTRDPCAQPPNSDSASIETKNSETEPLDSNGKKSLDGDDVKLSNDIEQANDVDGKKKEALEKEVEDGDGKSAGGSDLGNDKKEEQLTKD